MGEIPMNDGDEMDGLGRHKRYYRWGPGDRKRIKRQYNKRVRRAWKKVHRES